MRGFAILAFVAVSATLIPAQYPFGFATPVGASTPVLVAEPAWLGNRTFGYRVEHAPPGGDLIVGISSNRQDQTLAGLQLYLSLDPADLFFTSGGTADAAGQIIFPFPLTGPENPSLAGLQVYMQAAVSDPGSPGALGATQGVLLELEMHPLFAFTSSTALLSLVDVVAGTNTGVGGFATNSIVIVAVFAKGGRDLFVGTSDGLYVVDTLAPIPTGVYLAAGAVQSIAYDRIHERVYTLGFFSGQLRVFDGNRASPSFGSLITQTPNPNLFVSASNDGAVLVLNDAVGALEVRDADPASASYLQVIPTPPSPVPLGFGVIQKPAQVSPDGRFASIATTIPGSPGHTIIDRLDRVAGQWIDYDPVAPGYQPLSSSSQPGLPQIFLMFTKRDGTGLVLAGTDVSCRVDFDPAAPSQVVVAPAPIASTSFGLTYVALSPSGRFLVRRDTTPFGNPIPTTISLVDLATGVLVPFGTFPISSVPQDPIAVWR